MCTISAALHDVTQLPDSVPVRLPDGSTIQATHLGSIPITHPKCPNITAYLVPDLASHNLISIGQFCDAGCTALFTASDLRISFEDQIIATGTRDPTSRLWHLHLDSPSTPTLPPTTPTPPQSIAAAQITNEHNAKASPAQLVAFAHGALFSPTLSTLTRALKLGYLANFPGLTLRRLKKHPPISPAMIKGHMDHTRKNRQSTRPQTLLAPDTDESTNFPKQLSDGRRTHFLFTDIQEITGKTFSDQTGALPIPSSSGHTHQMIVYDFDSNSIHAKPTKGKSAEAIVKAYDSIYDTLYQAGLRPQLQMLDNECSTHEDRKHP